MRADTFTAVFELRQIVLGNSFPHYVHAGFWAGLRGLTPRGQCLAVAYLSAGRDPRLLACVHRGQFAATARAGAPRILAKSWTGAAFLYSNLLISLSLR